MIFLVILAQLAIEQEPMVAMYYKRSDACAVGNYDSAYRVLSVVRIDRYGNVYQVNCDDPEGG